jgi:hypothetical protein
MVGGIYRDGTKNSYTLVDSSINFLRDKLQKIIPIKSFLNGVDIMHLPRRVNSSLLLWLPIMDNYATFFPVVDTKTTLIVSKIVRGNIDSAIERRISTGADAIIVFSLKNTILKYKLIDKYDNIWVDTYKLADLATEIVRFFAWNTYNKKAQYVLSHNKYSIGEVEKDIINIFSNLCNTICTTVGTNVKFSSAIRCSFLTPNSMHAYKFAHISKKIVSQPTNRKDFTLTNKSFAGSILYRGSYLEIPSSNSELFLSIFKNTNLNYLIRLNCNTTKFPWLPEYYSDGDEREIQTILQIIKNTPSGVINMTNKGCLIYGTIIQDLRDIISKISLNLTPTLAKVH